ncbi:hypothetical protein QAD02_018131 [Eretmocerus hayati]|uniref:Uncharacterized protein n=1 Tax=Eretmocerus hayati TaxID=131215 RepID=A0ACC2PIC3_9HYME|nr:hypothetical protein QAD02_018131 [Eretmocerus hayati]
MLEKNSSNSILNDSTPEEFDHVAGEMTTNDMLKQIKSLINKSANAINQNVDEKTSSIASQITDAVLKIASFQADKGTIKQEMTEIKHRPKKGCTVKKKNIIIFGVDENDETYHPKEEIMSLLSVAPFSLEEIRVLRLGKAGADKIRPVKVIFNSHEEAKWALINQKSLCKDKI